MQRGPGALRAVEAWVSLPPWLAAAPLPGLPPADPARPAAASAASLQPGQALALALSLSLLSLPPAAAPGGVGDPGAVVQAQCEDPAAAGAPAEESAALPAGLLGLGRFLRPAAGVTEAQFGGWWAAHGCERRLEVAPAGGPEGGVPDYVRRVRAAAPTARGALGFPLR